MKKEYYITCLYCNEDSSGKKYCSNTCKQKSHYHSRKDKNVYHNQFKRAIKRKILLIEQRGGSCENCEYNKNLSALEFHHIEPKNKKFELNIRSLSNKNLNIIIEESKKCILICSNCHREEHHPSLNIQNIKEMISENDRLEFLQKKEAGKPRCVDCNIEINYTHKRCVKCNNISKQTKERPSKEEIQNLINNIGITKAAQQLNIARTTLKKWLK